MNKFKILLVFWLMVGGNLLAQTDEVQLAPVIIPPSPTVSSLGQYGLVPVNMSVGKISPEIPLYTFRTKNLTLPISLTYDGSAVKTDEISSWVGMHWSLNCGGVVGRIIRDDEDGLNYFTKPYPSSFLPSSPDGLQYLEDATMIPTSVDTEPDLFTYNFLGYSGKFVFDRTGEVVSMPRTNLRIQRAVVTSGPGSFIITTPDGVKYTFDATESSTMMVSYDASFAPAVTAWYLTKIEHPQGDVIYLTYSNSSYTYHLGITETHTRKTIYYSDGNCTPPPPCPDPGASHSYSSMFVTGKRLLKIESIGYGSIDFVSSKGRSDLDDYKLDGLTIKAPGGSVIKSFSLSYIFSNNTGFQNSFNAGHEDLKHRMFLKAVREKDNTGSLSGQYTMEYEDVDALPARLSFAQDHWGYFNGVNNPTLLPQNLVETDYTGGLAFAGIGGNRGSNGQFAKKGILKKITYPTGGSSSFLYGSNSYYSNGNVDIGGLRIEQVINNDPITQKNEVITYHYARHDNLSTSSGVTSGNPDYVTKYFTRGGCASVPHGRYSQCRFVALHSNNVNSLFSMNGNHIYYRFVTISKGPDLSAGVEEHEFDIDFDNTGIRMWGQDQIKDVPLSSTSWRSGREKDVRYYKKSNDDFVLVRHVHNSFISDSRYSREVPSLVVRKKFEPTVWQNAIYQCDASNISKIYQTYMCVADHYHLYHHGLFIDLGCVSLGNGGPDMQWVTYKWHPCYGKSIGETVTVPYVLDYVDAIEYRNVSHWVYQDKKIETAYDENGQNPVTTETNYFYDDVENAQLSRMETTQSDGKVVSISIKYPQDYELQASVANKSMVENHLIAYPVKKETSLNGNQISGDLIIYNSKGQPVNMYSYEAPNLQPAATHNPQQLVPPNNYKLRSAITTDPTGSNIVQVQLTDNFSTQYLWGYKNTLPIAEVKNSASASTFVNVSLVNEVTTNIAASMPETKLSPTFEVFSNQTINPNVTVTPIGSNSPASPLVSIMLRRTDNAAVVGTFNLNWGSNSLSATSLTPGEYQWSYYCGDVVFNNDFQGISLGITANYIGRKLVDKIYHTSFEETGVLNSSARTGRRVWHGQFTVDLPASNGHYVLTYWKKQGSNPWTLHQQSISVVSGTSQPVAIGEAGSLLDEVRLFPKDAQMTTYTYDPLVGVTSVTDANNTTSYFYYDTSGRLETIKDFNGSILKAFSYNYMLREE